MKKINVSASELNLEAIYKYNELARRRNIALVLENTKGLTKEKVELLSDNITISILGGLNPVKRKFAREHYQKRTYYTKREMLEILDVLEEIERLINPVWSDLEKAIFVYQRLCIQLHYNEYADEVKSRNLMVLVNDEGVCAGFALVYKEIMDRLGINCYYQNKSHHHAFNVLEIDNKYYGIDLTWDISEKMYNKCSFDYFATSNSLEFYGNIHHNLSDEKEEKMFHLSVLNDEQIKTALINIDMYPNCTIPCQYDYTVNKEIAMIGLNPIYIDNNVPCSYNNNTVSMLRSDGSSFLLIATGNSSNGINEYLYVEYNKSNNTIDIKRIYSEMDFLYLSNEDRKDVANDLLSRKRINEKVTNYNGYVGYMKYSRRFYRANFEEQVLNIYRRAC